MKRGTRVHCVLYGGRNGIIFDVHGTPSPQTVRHGNGMAFGGSARYDVVFHDGTVSRQIPETIIRCVQWRVLPGIASEAEIDAALKNAETVRLRKEEEARQAAIQRNKDREQVAKDYPHLIQNPDTGGKGAAKNLRIELKHHFPGVKFSVRSDYDSIRIGWTGGPETADVGNVAYKYEEGRCDGMTDYYEYNPSVFNDVFGGCKYVFLSREKA